eukprot:515334_1
MADTEDEAKRKVLEEAQREKEKLAEHEAYEKKQQEADRLKRLERRKGMKKRKEANEEETRLDRDTHSQIASELAGKSLTGKEKYTFANGDEYDGEWKNGAMDGQGIYTYKKSGNIYEGEWKENKKNG